MKKKKKNFRSQLADTKSINSTNDSLLSELKLATQGLFYISETDAEILPFSGQKVNEISPSEILSQTGNLEDCEIEERDFDEFFDRLTKIQDWFGQGETDRADKFLILRKILEDNLRDLKVFKIGRIRREIYFVGTDSDNCLKGIKTFAVET